MRNANEEDSIDSAERRARAAAQVRRTRALAVRLRTLRAHRDLNQEQLSQAADVPRQIISGLEQGGRPRPEAETVARLARALGVTPRQLRGCDPIPELSAADAELAAEAVAGDAAALELAAEAVAGDAAAPEREAAVAEPGARSAGAGPALGLTSLLTLPPGATVLQKYRPDGSVVLYVQIPATPAPRRPRRPPMGRRTTRYDGDETASSGGRGRKSVDMSTPVAQTPGDDTRAPRRRDRPAAAHRTRPAARQGGRG